MVCKNIFIIIFISLMFAVKAGAQEEKRLSLSLAFLKDTLETLEPWLLNIAIKNNNLADQGVFPLKLLDRKSPYNYQNLFLEFRKEGDMLWQHLKIPHQDLLISDVNFNDKKILKPGNIVSTGTLILLSPLRDSIFSKSINLYYVRSIYRPHDYSGPTNIEIVSPPVPLYIKKYFGVDSLAFQYLIKLQTPGFIYQPIDPIFIRDFQFYDEAIFITKNFPESKFAPWAHLYLVYKTNADVVKKSDLTIEKKMDTLREARKHLLAALSYGNTKVLAVVKDLMIIQNFLLTEIIYQSEEEIPSYLWEEFELKN